MKYLYLRLLSEAKYANYMQTNQSDTVNNTLQIPRTKEHASQLKTNFNLWDGNSLTLR